MARPFENFTNNVIPDLRDNLSSDRVAPSITERLTSEDGAFPLVTRLFTHERSGNLRMPLWRESQRLPIGEHRARVAVGKTEDSTRHPHDFIVDRREDETLFYFVDPEHQMGKSKRRKVTPLLPRKGDVRPKICTLIAVRMKDDITLPEIAMVRFRTAFIKDPVLLKMDSQLAVTRTLLDTDALPPLLEGHENDITFRMVVKPETTFVQSRYATPANLRDFLKGAAGNSTLKGKTRAYGILMNQFRVHLEAGRFAPLAETPETL